MLGYQRVTPKNSTPRSCGAAKTTKSWVGNARIKKRTLCTMLCIYWLLGCFSKIEKNDQLGGIGWLEMMVNSWMPWKLWYQLEKTMERWTRIESMYFPKKTHANIPACYVRNYRRVLLGWRLILSKFVDPTWGIPQIWTFPVEKKDALEKSLRSLFWVVIPCHTRIFKLPQVMFIASVALLTQKKMPFAKAASIIII